MMNKLQKKTIVGILLMFILVCASSCQSKNPLVGQWIVNGTNTANLPDSMILNENGTGESNGFSINWYVKGNRIYFDMPFDSFNCEYSISGGILTLKHDYRGTCTYTNINRKYSGIGYNKPNATEQEAREAIGYGGARDAFTLISHETSTNSETFLFERISEYPYGRYTEQFQVVANYNKQSLLWDYTGERINDVLEIRNIEGTWEYSSPYVGEFKMEISNFNDSTGEIQYAYRFHDSSWISGIYETDSGTKIMTFQQPDEIIPGGFSLKTADQKFVRIDANGITWGSYEMTKVSNSNNNIVSNVSVPSSNTNSQSSYSNQILKGLTTTRLSTRSGPGTTYSETGSYNNLANTWVQVRSRAWDNRNSIWWVEVLIGDQWLWTGYKRFDSSTLPLESIPISSYYTSQESDTLGTCIITADPGNAREGPGTEYKKVAYVYKGSEYSILDTAVASNGRVWFKIKDGDLYCWISSGITNLSD